MDVEGYKRARMIAKGKFARTKKRIEVTIAAVAARQTIEERYNDLKTAWRDLQRCHEEYLMKLDSEEEVEEAEQWIEKVEYEYFGVGDIVNEYLLNWTINKNREI